MNSVRIGQGIDVHRFDGSRGLRLCGIEIEHGPSLGGTSDADVALHAVTDALYGAVAAGDLGEHFPSSDKRWEGADSAVFLRHALDCVNNAGYGVANCDLTIVGEEPRIAPHREAMRRRLAELLGVGESLVSVKATTTDRLGFCGHREGLAATAIVLVERMSDE